MKRFSSETMRKAYTVAGFRERYAMEHGNKSIIYINGVRCFKFTYSTAQPYQDANGATFDTARGVWIS